MMPNKPKKLQINSVQNTPALKGLAAEAVKNPAFIRSGIEILGTFPKLHRSIHTPIGKQWAWFGIKKKRERKYYPVAGEYENYSQSFPFPATVT